MPTGFSSNKSQSHLKLSCNCICIISMSESVWVHGNTDYYFIFLDNQNVNISACHYTQHYIRNNTAQKPISTSKVTLWPWSWNPEMLKIIIISLALDWTIWRITPPTRPTWHHPVQWTPCLPSPATVMVPPVCTDSTHRFHPQFPPTAVCLYYVMCLLDRAVLDHQANILCWSSPLEKKLSKRRKKSQQRVATDRPRHHRW